MNEGIYTAQYIGKPVMGYKSNHTYQISIEKQHYVYIVEAIDAEETNMIQYASEISIRNNWKFVGEK